MRFGAEIMLFPVGFGIYINIAEVIDLISGIVGIDISKDDGLPLGINGWMYMFYCSMSDYEFTCFLKGVFENYMHGDVDIEEYKEVILELRALNDPIVINPLVEFLENCKCDEIVKMTTIIFPDLEIE